MKIYGREYGFRFSVAAATEIAQYCPEKKLEKIEDLLNGDAAAAMNFICIMAAIESKAYEQAVAFETGENPKPHLTSDMARSLTMEQFGELSQEVKEAFYGDSKPTVEVDEDAVKKKRKQKTTKSSAADQNE